MAWIQLTTDDLKGYLSGAECDGVTSAALATGQNADEVVESVISDTVQMIRGYVGKRYTLGEGAAIPHELKTSALCIVRGHVFTRLPGMAALNDESRRAAATEAMRQVRDVAAGNFVIEEAATPTEQVVAGLTVKVITTPERTASRAKTAGLI